MKIIKKLRHIGNVFKKKSKKKELTLTNPLRDWSTGLVLATLFFISGVTVIAFDFYFQLISPEIPEVSEKPLIYKDNDVREYAGLYNEKAKEFNELRNTQTYIPVVEEAVEDLGETEVEELLAEDIIDE